MKFKKPIYLFTAAATSALLVNTISFTSSAEKEPPEATVQTACGTATTMTTAESTTATVTTIPCTAAITQTATYPIEIAGIAPGVNKADADDISMKAGETAEMKFIVPGGELKSYEDCNGSIYLPEGLKCVKVTYGNGKEVEKIGKYFDKRFDWKYEFSMPENEVTLTIEADSNINAGRYYVKCYAIRGYRKFENGNYPHICVGGSQFEDAEIEIKIIGENDDRMYIGSNIASQYGDVNDDGIVNIADLIMLNMHLLNPEKYPFSLRQTANSDCFRDNILNANDGVLLMNYLCEIILSDKLGQLK